MSLTGKRYTDDFKTQMIELYNSYNSGQSVIKLSPRIWHSQRDTIQMDQGTLTNLERRWQRNQPKRNQGT